MSQENANRQASQGASEAAPKGFELELTLMLKGIDSAIPDGTSLVVEGKSIAKADIKAELQDALGLFQVIHDAVRAQKVGLQARTIRLPAVRRYAKNLSAAVVGYFGPFSPQLGQFGIKRHGGSRSFTAAELALRAAKARATRALRHTMGARQKEAIRASAATLTLRSDPENSSPAAPASPGNPGAGSDKPAA